MNVDPDPVVGEHELGKLPVPVEHRHLEPGTGQVGNVADEFCEDPDDGLHKHVRSKEEIVTGLQARGLRDQAAAFAGLADLASLASAYRKWALAQPRLYELLSRHSLDRERLPEGLEASGAAPLLPVAVTTSTARVRFGPLSNALRRNGGTYPFANWVAAPHSMSVNLHLPEDEVRAENCRAVIEALETGPGHPCVQYVRRGHYQIAVDQQA